MKANRTIKITTRTSESFKRYLNEVNNIPVLTIKEENDLCLKIEGGDIKAKDELISRNLRFVITIAKQFETATLPLEDLVNEGNIGLVLAAEKYNTSTGFKFISYAVYWIRKTIYEYITNTSKTIRLPSNKISSISKFKKKLNELEQREFRNIETYEVLDELNETITNSEMRIFNKYAHVEVTSLDNKQTSSDDELSLYDIIVDNSFEAPDNVFRHDDNKKELSVLLNCLKPRDKSIMESLFGLNTGTPATVDQVSENVGLTTEMIRKIKDKSLKAMYKELVK